MTNVDWAIQVCCINTVLSEAKEEERLNLWPHSRKTRSGETERIQKGREIVRFLTIWGEVGIWEKRRGNEVL